MGSAPEEWHPGPATHQTLEEGLALTSTLHSTHGNSCREREREQKYRKKGKGGKGEREEVKVQNIQKKEKGGKGEREGVKVRNIQGREGRIRREGRIFKGDLCSFHNNSCDEQVMNKSVHKVRKVGRLGKVGRFGR